MVKEDLKSELLHRPLAIDLTKVSKFEDVSKSTLFIDTKEEEDILIKDNHVIPNTTRNHYEVKGLDIDIIEHNI